jgi:predicted Zn-dependent protease
VAGRRRLAGGSALSRFRSRVSTAIAGLCSAALAVALGCASPPDKPQAKKRTVLLTEYDDAQVGRESAQDVKSELGVLEDKELAAYVDGIGRKLLRGVPTRGFDYQFYVVDMQEPNAFALPGGYIFVSRGLLALANSEDELACVIGHEITHAARRHAAAQQALEKTLPSLGLPGSAAKFASYNREMEREADEGGQILCAAAGYDPMAMSRFLTNLGLSSRLELGYTRNPSFFDTHPGSEERAASNAVRAREIRWRRDPALGDPRAALLRRIDGLEVGQRPEAGLFEGDRFLHPTLGFTIQFPSGWRTSNSNRAVGAVQPRGEALVFLTADLPPGEVGQVARDWVAKQQESGSLDVENSRPVKVGEIDAWRIEANGASRGSSVSAQLTFIPFHDAIWRVTGAAPAALANKYQGSMLATARSFRPISEDERSGIEVTRVRIATARAGEGLADLSRRTKNVWSVNDTAVYNAVFADHRYAGGESVKIAVREPYRSDAR